MQTEPEKISSIYYSKRIRLGTQLEWALFAKRVIPKNTCIGFYTGRYIKNKDFLKLDTLYGVSINPNTLILPFENELNVSYEDRLTHPLALMNEPRENQKANVMLVIQDFKPSEITGLQNTPEQTKKPIFFRGLAAFVCRDINTHEELTWHYGNSYEKVRKEKKYKAGSECTTVIANNSKDVLHPETEKNLLSLDGKVPYTYVFPVYNKVRSEREDEFFDRKKGKRKRKKDDSDNDSDSDSDSDESYKEKYTKHKHHYSRAWQGSLRNLA